MTPARNAGPDFPAVDPADSVLAAASRMVGRKAIPGLLSPHPLADGMPAMYDADPFTRQLCEGLDEVLAPILATLDSLPAYFDPHTAPADSLGYLAGWLSLALDAHMSQARRRTVVAQGVERTGRRGTLRGLQELIADVFESVLEPEDIDVIDPGGAQWSLQPGSPLPGEPAGDLVVRVRATDPGAVDARRLDALISSAKPAHLGHRVEITAR